MRRTNRSLRHLSLLAAMLVVVLAPASPSHAQAALTRDDITGPLSRFDTAPELDITALRQKALERSRSRSRNEPDVTKRPPIAPELQNLPSVTLDIEFDTDTPIVRPQSYETVGRLADALVHVSLLPYDFLIVGHTDATGRREANVLLSQRRADAVRDVLVNTFKISSKRIQTIGLGEEQFIDPTHPTSPDNLRTQIVTIAKEPEQSEQPAATPVPAAPAKKPSKKR
ncbi:OmpA family protein [Bradyrhizobium sp.]|uniref:OmpA family protein n=1 Tax=Bradyrhizobium sp. TaxID=376 RepID=UPI003C5F1415